MIAKIHKFIKRYTITTTYWNKKFYNKILKSSLPPATP